MKVGNKDIVDLRYGNAHSEDVLDASGAEVEEESVAVAQFDHDTSASLVAPGRKGATADERDPHFVRRDRLASREVVHPATDRRRWLVVGRELQPSARAATVGILGLVRAWLLLGCLGRGHDHCRDAG